jgi:hypothetical protein
VINRFGFFISRSYSDVYLDLGLKLSLSIGWMYWLRRLEILTIWAGLHRNLMPDNTLSPTPEVYVIKSVIRMASAATLSHSPPWHRHEKNVRSRTKSLRRPSHSMATVSGLLVFGWDSVLIYRRLRRLDSSFGEKTLELTAALSPSVSASVSPSTTPSNRETNASVNQISTDVSNSRNHGLIHEAYHTIGDIHNANVSVHEHCRSLSCPDQLRSFMLESAMPGPAPPSTQPTIASSTCQEESPNACDTFTNR